MAILNRINTVYVHVPIVHVRYPTWYVITLLINFELLGMMIFL